MPDENPPVSGEVSGVAAQETKHVCLHCGATSDAATTHCPQCGAAYTPTRRPSFAWGRFTAFAGVLAGALAFLLIFLLIAAFANSMSNRILSGLLIVFDLAAFALAVRVIWLAVHGRAPEAPFLIGLSVTLVGLLSTCSAMLFSMGGFKFN